MKRNIVFLNRILLVLTAVALGVSYSELLASAPVNIKLANQLKELEGRYILFRAVYFPGIDEKGTYEVTLCKSRLVKDGMQTLFTYTVDASVYEQYINVSCAYLKVSEPMMVKRLNRFGKRTIDYIVILRLSLLETLSPINARVLSREVLDRSFSVVLNEEVSTFKFVHQIAENSFDGLKVKEKSLQNLENWNSKPVEKPAPNSSKPKQPARFKGNGRTLPRYRYPERWEIEKYLEYRESGLS